MIISRRVVELPKPCHQPMRGADPEHASQRAPVPSLHALNHRARLTFVRFPSFQPSPYPFHSPYPFALFTFQILPAYAPRYLPLNRWVANWQNAKYTDTGVPSRWCSSSTNRTSAASISLLVCVRRPPPPCIGRMHSESGRFERATALLRSWWLTPDR